MHVMDGQREGHGARPYWSEALVARDVRRLEGAIPADVAILGAGFTGLATAYFLKRADPSLRIVILERERVGAGASGASGGMCTTRVGLGLAATAAMFGREHARQAHAYAEQAVELVERLVRHNRIDCDYERPGLLRVASTPAAARHLQEDVLFAQRLGIRGIDFLDGRALHGRVAGVDALGAWWEARSGLLHPGKLLQGMRDLVERVGVEIYERAPVLDLQRRIGRVFVRTRGGGVLAGKVAVTANAYSHQIAQLRNKQTPAFIHAALTEPLTPAQLHRLAWEKRQGVEHGRGLAGYRRLTQDNRLLLGSRDVALSFGGRMNRELDRDAFARLEEELGRLFEEGERPRITHRWGGPISMPLQPVPALGYVGSQQVVYSLGCMGHGLALAHMHGWTLADLLRGERTERTEVFFVNRAVVPWPPEPLRMALSVGLRALLGARESA